VSRDVKASASASAAANTLSPNAASSDSVLKSSPARACRAATSSSVNVSRPANTSGRSSGVTLLFAQTPCRSGWPSAVRGGDHAAPSWPAAGTGTSVTTATATTAATIHTASRRRILTPHLLANMNRSTV